ncbi:CPBP family intramembrane glutamic endopeptidase [Cryobacterium sp. Y82]|uniref:CPBP family intramembrane glutamic endopeptidase n=1 Tax=Cryobacterium sp. Y82 TaxID=2045017 RepID=UPI000CE42EDA|nr:CPBP family intramembrane glutamic endopeptidase [Cryobacterium sp. Y82]
MGALVQPVTRQSNLLMPAGIGIVVAMVLLVSVGATVFDDPNVALLLGYLCVWVPLLAAIGVTGVWIAKVSAPAGSGGGSIVRLLRLSIRPIDLVWGLAAGLLARTVASLIEIGVYGSMGTTGATFGETVYDFWWLFGALLAPVLLAPVVEELFFRGLVLRAVYEQVAAARGRKNGNIVDTPSSTSLVPGVSQIDRSDAPDARRQSAGGAAGAIAIAVSGLTFALMHLVTIDVGSTDAIVVVGMSTLIFGMAAASVSLATGRIGGAIIAHVTFNSLVIVPALVII